MDDLELLKKDWNKAETEFKEYSENEIYTMIKHKSVSVVKVLLLIGLIEIVLWSLYGYFNADFPYFRMILFSGCIILAVLLFRRLKTGQNSLSLMKNILNLRKLIFGYAGISFLLIVLDNLIHFDFYTRDFMAGAKDGWNEGHDITSHTNPESMIPGLGNYAVFGFFMLISFYIIYVIYKRTYGKILSDLRKNYTELSRTEEKAF
ncbi:hypothetical protein [Chryseobacterium vrystaatense]|uniref:Uncharacterized protein n=1 Tax=Chryseobacterium vrystaatense TaxID=307480 RepID=A0A1M5PJQ1_9FLAO|nr:hypothetical protein [Chryseobacterium vrystaatense]SHH01719.1 hypothetical protein SAMN02787073_0103 [Chryseobacterium vrystaatense]